MCGLIIKFAHCLKVELQSPKKANLFAVLFPKNCRGYTIFGMESVKSNIICLLLFILVANASAFSQDDGLRRNCTYLELGGNAFIYSFNYERLIGSNANVRIGFSGFPGGNHIVYLLPVTFSKMIGKNQNMFEFGAGLTVDYESGLRIENKFDYFWTFIIGYRYRSTRGHISYRLAITPQVIDGTFFPVWPSIAIGFIF